MEIENFTCELPISWTNYELRSCKFKVPYDSNIFRIGINTAVSDFAGNILDLGCGSTKPALDAIQYGFRYTGIDIDQSALEASRYNLFKIGMPQIRLVEGDVTNENLEVFSDKWDLVVANLPFLPTPADGFVEVQADGGRDGLKLTPIIPMKIADRCQAKKIVMNISTLADWKEFAYIIDQSNWSLINIHATLINLGPYAESVWDDYISKKEWKMSWEVMGQIKQIVFSLELERVIGKKSKQSDVSKMFNKCIDILEKDLNKKNPGVTILLKP